MVSRLIKWLIAACLGLSTSCNGVSASLPTRNSQEEPEFGNEEELQLAVDKAEREAMEARAEYMLRNKIIQSVVIAHPVLKAVHGGSDELFADRYVYCTH